MWMSSPSPVFCQTRSSTRTREPSYSAAPALPTVASVSTAIIAAMAIFRPCIRPLSLNQHTLPSSTVGVLGTLLAAHKAGTLTGEPATAEPAVVRVDDALRRVEATEAQLADALEAVERERARAEALERRLELVEERQADEPTTELSARAPEVEPQDGAPGIEQEAAAGGSGAPAAALVSRGSHRAGVVTLEPLEGEQNALGEATALVAEWRRLRGEEARQGSAVERARAEERRWEIEIELIGEHGLALPPETEPLHPSRRDDHLRWRRMALRRARRQRRAAAPVPPRPHPRHLAAVAGHSDSEHQRDGAHVLRATRGRGLGVRYSGEGGLAAVCADGGTPESYDHKSVYVVLAAGVRQRRHRPRRSAPIGIRVAWNGAVQRRETCRHEYPRHNREQAIACASLGTLHRDLTQGEAANWGSPPNGKCRSGDLALT